MVDSLYFIIQSRSTSYSIDNVNKSKRRIKIRPRTFIHGLICNVKKVCHTKDICIKHQLTTVSKKVKSMDVRIIYNVHSKKRTMLPTIPQYLLISLL